MDPKFETILGQSSGYVEVSPDFDFKKATETLAITPRFDNSIRRDKVL